MFDLRFLEENSDFIVERTGMRDYDVDFDTLFRLLKKRRETITELDSLRADRNVHSHDISRLKKAGEDAQDLIDKVKTLKDDIKLLEDELRTIEEDIHTIHQNIPNIPHKSVPEGLTEEENEIIKVEGEIPEFDFNTLPHWELGEMHDILDFSRSGKMCGSGFVIFKGQGARLERAMINLMLDIHTKKFGYTEILCPYIIKDEALFGTGHLPKSRDDMYKLDKENLYLIPTSEASVINVHREEILKEEDLPLKYVSYSACFRREAGAAGTETRGLMRMHQFDKVELIKFTEPENSYDELEKMLSEVEYIMNLLELPYRITNLCAGELAFQASKTYDVEVWIPSEERYREVSSCSNAEAFQSRRADIRYRDIKTNNLEYIHTLNGSGLALSRSLLALIENHQQKDGSIKIPDALIPYMDGVETISYKNN
jgi:seryl-tRNA synthetase